MFDFLMYPNRSCYKILSMGVVMIEDSRTKLCLLSS